MSSYPDKVARLMVAANTVWGASQSAGLDAKLVPNRHVAELRAAFLDLNDVPRAPRAPRAPPAPPAAVYEFQGKLYASIEAVRDVALATGGVSDTGRLIALAAKVDPDAAFALGQRLYPGWKVTEREVQS